MKTLKLLFLIPFLFGINYIEAQTVTIPDAGFVNFLQYTYPSCMSGNLLDTTCTDIVNETNLNIPTQYSISNIYGVQFFDNLSVLSINYHPITSIPFLPQNLIELNAAYCNLTTITNLPNTIEKIEITSNDLTSLPTLPAGLVTYYRGSMPGLPIETSLPVTLELYNVQQCNVVNLPTLPSGLKNLSIGSNYSINIPILPAGLETLGIDHLNLTSLPPIPASLTYLWAANNNFVSLTSFPPILDKLYLNNCPNLTTIQNLPNTLQQFYAQSSNISFIDYLPNSIFTFDLHNNDLSSLPNIPNSASLINLENNNLTSLPTLPAVVYNLQLSNNSLYCIPFLPATISTLTLNNNNFTCLPNILPSMTSTFQSYPLCEGNDPIDNPFGCLASEGIEGYVFMDQNTDCSYQSTDVQMKNVPVTVNDNLGNQITSASTYTNGRYYFNLNTAQYEVVVDTIAKPYMIDCVNPGIDTNVVLSVANPLAGNVNFGLKCKPGFDVGTKSVHAVGLVFPGQLHTLNVKSGDLTNYYNLNCSNGVSGTVTITVTGPVIFQNISSGSLTPTIVGNIYTYTIADFGAVNPDLDFRLDFKTATTAVAGDLVCVNVIVTPLTGDINPTNNNFSTCYSVVNSYDPNNKSVYPSNITPDYLGYLTYTINFQNTGNAPAFHVRLEDTLSSFVDWTSFEVIDYSHEMHYALTNDKLVVYYPNIMLIDSTTSEPDSKGYITYRVKTNGNLLDGDEIENTAYIYFDFNSPVVTNTIITTVQVDDLGFDNSEFSNVRIYPNPSDKTFNVLLKENVNEINILDQQGKIIQFTYDEALNIIDLGDNKAGIYFMQLILNDRTVIKKLIKK